MVAPRTPVVALAVIVTILASTSGAVASTAAVSATSADEVSATSTAAVPDTSADDDAVADAADVTSIADTATATPDPNNTTLVKDGEELVFEPAPNQTVRGETTLDPGTEVVITLEGSTFYRGTTTTVTDEGTFNVTADMSSASPGTTIGVSVRTNPSEGKETLLVATTASIDCAGDCPSGSTNSDSSETTLETGETGVQPIVEVTQGQIASIDVSFGDTDTITVSIGGPSVNYVVNGTVHDENGDGQATVLFYTDEAGTDAPTLSVIDAGERRVVEANAETSLDSPLAPGAYGLSVYSGPSATGEPEAKGRIVVFDAAASESPATSANTSIFTEGGELVLDPAPNQTIRGETDQEPGTNLSLQIEGETFLSTSVATVTDEGTFEATVDLSDAGQEKLEIRVYHDDTLLAETAGRVACSGDCEGVTTTADGASDDTSTAYEGTSSPGADAPNGDDSGNRLFGGFGMIAVGGVLAVVGIGVLLGLFRR